MKKIVYSDKYPGMTFTLHPVRKCLGGAPLPVHKITQKDLRQQRIKTAKTKQNIKQIIKDLKNLKYKELVDFDTATFLTRQLQFAINKCREEVTIYNEWSVHKEVILTYY